MRIGELAQRGGVQASALRYYEQVGLLPEPSRSGGGYRQYDADALDRLKFLKAAQRVGLTLGEIREIIGLRDHGETPCGHVAGLIRRHLDEVAERIRELQDMRTELQLLDRRARVLDPGDCAPGDVCHLIPKRR